MKRTGPILAAALLLAAPGAIAGVEDPVARGKEIAREADSRDRGYGDSKAGLVMILEDRKGRQKERRLHIQILEAPNESEGEKSLVVFDEPLDIRGTALLSYSHIREPDDQWLYLPALKRVKRISSVNKSGSFVGSEFAYEDITGQEFGKYSYLWLRDEACGELDCHVVERRPLYHKSGYVRLVTWYDKVEYRIQRIDFYDLKDEFLKTLSFTDYRRYLEKYWRPHLLVMDNERTGKTTRLVYEGYEFKTGLDEDDFGQSSLKRAR